MPISKKVKSDTIFILVAAAFLSISPVKDAASQDIHSLQAGFMYYHFDYKEVLTPPLKSTEYGWLPGFSVRYHYRGGDNPGYGRLLFDYTHAETTYDGSTQAGDPLIDKTENTFWTLELDIGYTLEGHKDFPVDLTGYTGIGRRVWRRRLGGAIPYREDYSWNYFPLGARLDFTLSPRLDGAVDACAKVMFGGKMTVKDWGLEFDLGNEVGWRVEFPFDYFLTDGWSFVAAPWYEYSAIGESNQVSGFYEPSSNTHQYGIHTALRAWF